MSFTKKLIICALPVTFAMHLHCGDALQKQGGRVANRVVDKIVDRIADPLLNKATLYITGAYNRVMDIPQTADKAPKPIGTINKTNTIDNTLKSRLKVVHIRTPNMQDRIKALQALQRIAFKESAHQLNEEEMSLIAENTDGYSYRDLMNIMQSYAIDAYIHDEKPTPEDIENFIEACKPN